MTRTSSTGTDGLLGARRADTVAGVAAPGQAFVPRRFSMERCFGQHWLASAAEQDGRVHFPGKVSVPARPMLGVLGVLPSADAHDPGPHGGNMDTVDVKAGSVFHVRAQRDGGWLVLGDAHGIQGEGEITCTGLEIDAVTRLRVERSPGFPCHNPVIETADEWQTMATHPVWADAVRGAFAEMVELVRHRWRLSDEDANVLVGTVAHVKNSSIWGTGGLCLGVGPYAATVRLGLTKDVEAMAE